MTTPVVVGAAPLSPQDVVAVARHGAPVSTRSRRDGAGRGIPSPHRRTRRRPRTALRRLDRIRRPRDDLHRTRAASPAAAEPHPVARGRHGRRGRDRGRARAAAAAPADPRVRPHGCAPRRRRDLRRDARRRHHARRARVRLARLLGRPRAARRTSRSPRWGRATCACGGELLAAAADALAEASIALSCCRRRRASRSSTAPTECSGCCSSRSTTSACCSTRPTSPPRCRSSRSSAPTPSSPKTSWRCARRPGRRRRPRTCARSSPTRPIMASHRDPACARACRTRTRCAARRRCTAPRATRSITRRSSPRASSPRPSTTPS